MAQELLTQVIDATTQQSEIRSLTKDELASFEALRSASQLAMSEVALKEAARESALAKLKALGLTEAEIAAL